MSTPKIKNNCFWSQGKTNVKKLNVAIMFSYFSIYFIWGSVYLANRFSVETIPPLIVLFARNLIAGVFLFAWGFWILGERPSLKSWTRSFVSGIMFFVISHSLMFYAAKITPSSVISLIVAFQPSLYLIGDWLLFKRLKPDWIGIVGLFIGLVGSMGLIWSESGYNFKIIDASTLGMIAVLVASCTWVAGAFYTRTFPVSRSAIFSSGMSLISSCPILLILSILSDSWLAFPDGGPSLRSLIALGYIILCGPIISFTAFNYLLTVQPAFRVSTYAFVNPVVAYVIGVTFGQESLSRGSFVFAVLMICSVILICLSEAERDSHRVTSTRKGEIFHVSCDHELGNCKRINKRI